MCYGYSLARCYSRGSRLSIAPAALGRAAACPRPPKVLLLAKQCSSPLLQSYLHPAQALNHSSNQRSAAQSSRAMVLIAAQAQHVQHEAKEVPFGMDSEAALIEQLTSIPQISKAILRPSRLPNTKGVDITVLAPQHNLPANSKRQLQYTVLVPDTLQPGQVLSSGIPTELQSSVLNSLAPSGQRALIAKSHSDGVLLEFWAHNRLVKELQVSKTLHGPIINDGWFSRGAVWNLNEDIIVYVAEASAEEQTPKFGNSSSFNSSTPSSGGSSNAASAGNNNAALAAPRTWQGVSAAIEDWGELNTGKRPPSLYALNTKTWQVHQLAGLAGLEASWGQPVWTPDGKGLVAVQWPHKALNFPGTARRLGIVHCYNRPCGLYYIPYKPSAIASSTEQQQQQSAVAEGKERQHNDTEVVQLTAGLLSALSPIFSPEGNQLLFVSQEAAASSGVHAATSALYSLQWSGQPDAIAKPRAVIPVVQQPSTPGGFPGLYAFTIHEQGCLENDTLLITSQWNSHNVILSVGLKDGKVEPVTPLDASKGSWTLQGVCNGLVAATLSAPNQPPQLMLATAPSSSSNSWHWQPVEPLQPDLELLPEAAAALAGVHCEVLEVMATVGDTDIPVQAIIQVSKHRKGPAPAVVVPHGGPHTAIPANYYMPFTLLSALGYCIVAVNYRGSLGFGEASVQSLPGNIGRNDVEDCMAALDAAVAAGYADKSQAAVVGGSHGGFLSGHLMGQYPDRFKCAGLRNPVLNIALMVGVTDIPDWCYIEAYGTEEGGKRFSAEPSSEDMSHFWSMSPIKHIGNVSSPMMFMLGAKDRRVPLDDGWRYVDALKSRGVKTRVLVFPEDSHALDKPQTEFEQWLNLAWWLKQHINTA